MIEGQRPNERRARAAKCCFVGFLGIADKHVGVGADVSFFAFFNGRCNRKGMG